MAIFLSLLLALLLCGCSQETTPPETTAPRLAQPAAIQRPVSVDRCLEEGTGGALQAYSLEGWDVRGIRGMGETLLVFSGSERTTLTALHGAELAPVGQLDLDFLLDTRDPTVQLGDREFSFYDPVNRETVILDETLRTIHRIPAPEGLTGVPILSCTQDILYYAAESGIFAWDLQSDLHRCLKEISTACQSAAGICLDGSVLQIRIWENDQARTLFLSTASGRILQELSGDAAVKSRDGMYTAALPWAVGNLLVFGCEEEEPRLFLPRAADSVCRFLDHRLGAITYTSPEPGSLLLEYYDLDAGERSASLTLDAAQGPLSIADTASALYLLMPGPGSGSPTLYRWDISRSALSDSADYTAPWVWEVDGQALSSCRDYANKISEQYGIQVLTGAELRATGYTLEPETQPGILMRELELLDRRLSQLPASLLRDTAAHFSGMTLAIVRQIQGRDPEHGLQLMEGDRCCIVIPAGADSEQALYHGLFLAMETHILTESSALDQWESLNPQQFRYSYGKIPQVSGLYLEGEQRTFVSAASMSLPREDRASVFALAMLPGQAQVFQGPAMQAKLRAVCQGIREAYGFKKETAALPWEQYLTASAETEK